MSLSWSHSTEKQESLAVTDLTVGECSVGSLTQYISDTIDNKTEGKFLYPGIKKMTNEVEELEWTMGLTSEEDGLIYADKNGFLKVYKHK